MFYLQILLGIAIVALFSSLPVLASQNSDLPNLEALLIAAKQAQAKGDFVAAAVDYRSAVKLRPDAGELWADLGLMQHQNGEVADAIKSFSEAARLGPSLFVPQLFLGIEYLGSNRAESAIPHLVRAVKINPTDLQAAMVLGRAFAVSGRGDRAAEMYWKAVELSPGNGSAWLGLGLAGLQEDSFDVRSMEATFKNTTYARLRAAEILAEQGKLLQAAKAFRSILSASSSPPPCAHSSYGIVLLRLKEVSEARLEFESEAKLDSTCGLAKLGLAAVHLVQGQPEAALKEITAIGEADQGFLLGSLPLLRGGISPEQGEQLLRMAEDQDKRGAIAVPPGDADFLLDKSTEPAPLDLRMQNKSKRTGGVGSKKEPEISCRSVSYHRCSEMLAPRINSLPVTSLLVLAQCAFYSGDYRTASRAAGRLRTEVATRVAGLYWESKADHLFAIEALTRAGQADPNSPGINILLGDLYRQKENWDAAEEKYRRAVAIDPKNEAGRFGLAIALFNSGKSEEALSIDEGLLTETPDDPKENLLAGEILVKNQLLVEAESHLKRIQNIKATFMPRVHTLLGDIYMGSNRLDEALSEFTEGEVDDQDGSTHYKIGRVYLMLGDRRKAENAFEASKRLKLLKQSAELAH